MKETCKTLQFDGCFSIGKKSDAHETESVLARIPAEMSSLVAFLLSLLFMFHHVSSTCQLRSKRAVSPKDLENQPQLDSIPGERRPLILKPQSAK